jgi:hypothetical protein
MFSQEITRTPFHSITIVIQTIVRILLNSLDNQNQFVSKNEKIIKNTNVNKQQSYDNFYGFKIIGEKNILNLEDVSIHRA